MYSLENARASVGKGWSPLIDVLWHACKQEGVTIHQVKEKFGGLRFYVGGAPEWLHDFIHKIESLSYQICEGCGGKGEPRSSGWIKTLCEGCHNERQEQRARVGRSV